MTLPTPAITPSVRKLANALSGSSPPIQADSAPAPASMASISGVAQEKTAWKTSASTPKNMTVAGQGRLNQRIVFAPNRSSSGAWVCASCSTSRTHR